MKIIDSSINAAVVLGVPLLCIPLVFSCGTSVVLPTVEKCTVENIEVSISASDRLNMDEEGNSLSTTLRVFQLKTGATFKNADFEELWREPKVTLDEDFLSMSELTLYPSKQETLAFPKEAEAGFIAVMGVFRKQTGTTWRVWTPIKAPSVLECKRNSEPTRKLSFVVEDYQIGVQKQK